jgi:hypothetical protein
MHRGYYAEFKKISFECIKEEKANKLENRLYVRAAGRRILTHVLEV